MTYRLNIPARNRRRITATRGFTFTEVLFAVVILGVGFIMLAAIFPVALSQTRQSADESAGAQAATSAMAQVAAVFDGSDWNLSSVPTNPTWAYGSGSTSINESLPITLLDATPGGMKIAPSPNYNSPVHVGQVHALGVYPYNGCAATPALRLNQILPSNPRIAWVIFYRRDEVLSYYAGAVPHYVPSPYAMVICVPISSGVNSEFTTKDLPPEGWGSVPANMAPQLLHGSIGINKNNDGFLLTTQPIMSAAGVDGQPWSEGTYVIVADDKDTSASPTPGLFNGHIYRIGALATLNGGFRGQPQYTLMPGWDFKPEQGVTATTGQPVTKSNISSADGASFYIVGRYYQGNRYIGPSQDIGAFTTMVKVQ